MKAPDTLGGHQLERYVDGELGPAAAEKVEARLRSDPEARAQLARLRAQGSLLRALADAQTDEASLGVIWSRVEEGLDRAPPLTLGERVSGILRRFRTTGLWMGGGLAVAGAAALLVMMARHGTPARHHGVFQIAEPAPAPITNLCDIENLELQDSDGTVLTVPDSHGSRATIIWITARTQPPASNTTEHPVTPVPGRKL